MRTSVGVYTYPIPPHHKILEVLIHNLPKDQFYLLEYSTNRFDSANGKPRYYYVDFRDGKQCIILHPTPDFEYHISIKYLPLSEVF